MTICAQLFTLAEPALSELAQERHVKCVFTAQKEVGLLLLLHIPPLTRC